MIKARVIGSGSKGNATVIYDGKTTLLIDFGVSKKRLKEGIADLNMTMESIDYAFFTHNHTDHIASIKYLEPSKIYALDGTIPLKQKNKLELFKKYQFGTFFVTPLLTSHDAPNPCGYLIENGDEKLVYITDTGYVPKKTTKYIVNADYYIFESNHDIDMLYASGRPTYLINRIKGRVGHLSNVQSATYVGEALGDKTKKIILAHLSEECNSEEVALESYKKVFEILKIDSSNIEIKCAKQWESTDL